METRAIQLADPNKFQLHPHMAAAFPCTDGSVIVKFSLSRASASHSRGYRNSQSGTGLCRRDSLTAITRGSSACRNQRRARLSLGPETQPYRMALAAAGTLAMISGEPGSGKTWVALAIAAALSRGRAPFTGEKAEPCTTLYASREHGASQVIHPRFIKLNGDAARLATLRGPVVTPTALEDPPADASPPRQQFVNLLLRKQPSHAAVASVCLRRKLNPCTTLYASMSMTGPELFASGFAQLNLNKLN